MKGRTWLMIGIGVLLVGLVIFGTTRTRPGTIQGDYPVNNYPTLVKSTLHQVDFIPPTTYGFSNNPYNNIRFYPNMIV